MNFEDVARNQAELSGAFAAAVATLAHALSEQPGIDAAALKEALMQHYSRIVDQSPSPLIRGFFAELAGATDKTIRT